MDLQKLIEWLFMNQAQRDKAREMEARDLNSFVPRAPDGNIQQQGLGGIFSDSLPLTPMDRLKMHPKLYDLFRQQEQPLIPMHQPQQYKGWL